MDCDRRDNGLGSLEENMFVHIATKAPWMQRFRQYRYRESNPPEKG